MENNSLLNDPYSRNNHSTDYNAGKISYGAPGLVTGNTGLTAEVGNNFFRYLKKFNLSAEDDLLILSPSNHYYYDEFELKSVRTVINLKKLNMINNLDTFVQTLYHLLPPNVNLIGCFDDIKTLKWNEILSGLSARFNNLMDLKTDRIMDKKDVSDLLRKYGFALIDMTEMNGLTYFYAKTNIKIHN